MMIPEAYKNVTYFIGICRYSTMTKTYNHNVTYYKSILLLVPTYVVFVSGRPQMTLKIPSKMYL